jgi:anti-sigma factor ChrR (cupin superfamily)
MNAETFIPIRPTSTSPHPVEADALSRHRGQDADGEQGDRHVDRADALGAGARLPQHEHVAIEQTFVLEGSFADHMGVCRAGNYVWRRAGSRHDAWTDEGCLMLAFFLKPNTFFD